MEHYQPSIHVTSSNGIGMDVGGKVIVLPIETWHDIVSKVFNESWTIKNNFKLLPDWRWKLGKFLLKIKD